MKSLKVLMSMFAVGFFIVIASFAEMKQPWIGQSAPPFTLSSLNQGKVSLSDFRGKIVVLHFGAGW